MRSVRSIFWAGSSWSLLSFALLLPTIFGAPSLATLFTTGFVVGIQAAQSSYIQVDPPTTETGNFRRALFYGIVTVILTACAATIPAPLAVTLVSTTGGAVLGIRFGQRATSVLRVQGGLAFQRFQATRSLILVGGIATSSFLWSTNSLLASTSGAILIVALSEFAGSISAGSLKSSPNRHPRPPSDASVSARWSTLWVGMGLLAALYYRNDVNWLRSSLAKSGDFETWHVALVAYSAIQGIVGFIVIQKLFSRRDFITGRVALLARRYRLMSASLWVALSLLAFAITPALPIFPAVLIAAILACFVGVLSGVVHVLRLNWAAYLAGTAGTTVLLVFIAMDVAPRETLLATNVTAGVVLSAALFSPRINRWQS